MDQLAQGGLRFNNFHTTALCSPTRIALKSGPNHHTANAGSIMESSTAYPGNTGQIPNSVAPLTEMLRLNGYSTGAFGKWHETGAWETSVSGPFDRWPTHQSFDNRWRRESSPEAAQRCAFVRRALRATTAPVRMSGGREFSDDCGLSGWYCPLSERACGMRSIGHPDFQYTPWSPERRAAASKAARARAKATEAKSGAKIQRKKTAPRSKPKAP
jgi:Sulfatase